MFSAFQVYMNFFCLRVHFVDFDFPSFILVYGSCMSIVAKKEKKKKVDDEIHIQMTQTLIIRFVSSCMHWCNL